MGALFIKLLIPLQAFFISVLPVSSFTEGVTSQPKSFLPHQAQDRHEKTVASLIYRGLFKYDIYGSITPDLAETWKTSADGISYTITIKKNQKWSDGSTITADDIIYTSFNLPQLRDVATDKIDARTVRFTLPNKYAPFLNLLTAPIMKNESIKNDNPLMPVSSGTYKVLAVRRQGPEVKEVALINTTSTPNFKKLVFKYYANEEELLIGAKLGEVDGFIHSSELEIPSFRNYKFPLQSVYYAIYFNLQNDALKDREIRQKMEKVLPKDRLVSIYGIPVQGPISRSAFTDESLSFDPYDELYTDDLSATKKLVLTAPDLPAHRTLAKQIQDLWEDKLDLDIELNFVDPDRITDTVVKPRKFELLLYGQEIGRDPDRYVNWHSTQKNYPGLNLSGFEQVRADRALEEGRNTLQSEKRVVHYKQFQKVVHEETPAIFLYHPYVNYYITNYISNVGEKYTFTYADRFLDINAWVRKITN